MNNKKKCFVIMPFSETDSLAEEKWTEIFEHIIKPAVEESGFVYECKRYSLGRANIVKDILEDLNRAQVVIADLTDNNANVLWELGVRHTLKRGTILISQDKKFIPSDLKDYPVIPYDQTKAGFDKFKDAIKKRLEDIEADPDKSDSPVGDFLTERNIALLAAEKSANIKKLGALISELSRNIDKVTQIISIANKNQELRKKREKGITIPVRLFETACLELLVSYNYIAVSEKLLREAVELHDGLISHNRGLELWQNDDYAQSIEENIVKHLPSVKDGLVSLLVDINEVRLDYINDNYLEPSIPAFVFSSPEHEEYLKLTK